MFWVPAQILSCAEVCETQMAKPQGFEEGDMDGGVSCSSCEASNDCEAKSWQIVTAQERN